MTESTTIEAEDLDAGPGLDPGLTQGFLGPRVRVLWNLLSARMLAALAPYDLKTGAFSTLALISANPGCSQTELARGLGMDKSAVVPIIDELEHHGLAQRVRSALDRRRHALVLTQNGETVMHSTHASADRAGRPIRQALSPEEYELLLSLLDRAHAALAGD